MELNIKELETRNVLTRGELTDIVIKTYKMFNTTIIYENQGTTLLNLFGMTIMSIGNYGSSMFVAELESSARFYQVQMSNEYKEYSSQEQREQAHKLNSEAYAWYSDLLQTMIKENHIKLKNIDNHKAKGFDYEFQKGMVKNMEMNMVFKMLMVECNNLMEVYFHKKDSIWVHNMIVNGEKCIKANLKNSDNFLDFIRELRELKQDKYHDFMLADIEENDEELFRYIYIKTYLRLLEDYDEVKDLLN